MRIRWLATVTLVGALACQGGSENDVDEATMTELRAIKQAIVDGHRTRDRVSLDSLYPDDYVASDSRGDRRTKADLMASLAGAPDMIGGEYKLQQIRRWGNVVVASGHGRMTYRSVDSTWVSEYNSVNVFERRQGKWRYASAYLP